MKKSSIELKSMARGALIGRYGSAIGAQMIFSLISTVFFVLLGFVSPSATGIVSSTVYWLISFIISLLLSLFSTGLSKIYLNISRGEQTQLSDLFYIFQHHPDKVILLSLITTFITFICQVPFRIMLYISPLYSTWYWLILAYIVSLLGTILGYFLTLPFSQIYFLYLDDHDKSVMEIIRESRELMRGNIGRLFYLQISFFGLELLCAFTLYIGYLWLVPYMSTTLASFYRNLISEV